MTLKDGRNQLSIVTKNGIGFIMAAVVIWSIITVIFLQSIDIHQKNLYMLFSTGLMFPLSVGISSLLKADWKLENHPLGKLSLYLNLAQIIYFPILIFGMIKSPHAAIIFFSIITGAHFFPYGWLYNTKAYFLLAPLISITILVLGLFLQVEDLWLIPLTMIGFFLVLIFWLYLDYKRKLQLFSS